MNCNKKIKIFVDNPSKRCYTAKTNQQSVLNLNMGGVVMARKNNPQQTKENILSVSTKLFLEKGYDQTSMQDIVAALGMSKGAIFHHFKSKEDIFDAVIDRQYDYAEQEMQQWMDETVGLSGKEKLELLIELNFKDRSIQMDNLVASQFQKKNARFIVAIMQINVNKSAPFLAKIIREGIEDGSFATEFPDECAEVFSLLINTWCDHVLFACDLPRLRRRMEFLQEMARRMGVDVINDQLIDDYMELMATFYEKHEDREDLKK